VTAVVFMPRVGVVYYQKRVLQMSFESFLKIAANYIEQNSFVKVALVILISLLLYLTAYVAGESIGKSIYYITH
jgi:hypothetical protein